MSVVESFYIFRKRFLLPLLSVIFLFALSGKILAQEQPPFLNITTEKDLSFGAFSVTSGGDVSVDAAGGRSSAGGGIILLNIGSFSFGSAQFRLESNPGTMLALVYNPAGYTLTNGSGGTMTLYLGAAGQVSPDPIIITDLSGFLTLYLGGTLSVPGSNPPGSYTGSFDITFSYQ